MKTPFLNLVLLTTPVIGLLINPKIITPSAVTLIVEFIVSVLSRLVG